MVIKLLKKLWLNLLVGLDPMYTFEGFELTRKSFVLPPDPSGSDPRLKRRLTICNLFANQHQPIDTIAQVLDTGKGRVVSVLIDEGLIKERRRHKTRGVKRERRRASTVFVPSSHDLAPSAVNSPGFTPTRVASSRIVTLFGTEPSTSSAASNPKEDPPATSVLKRGNAESKGFTRKSSLGRTWACVGAALGHLRTVSSGSSPQSLFPRKAQSSHRPHRNQG